MRTTVNSLGLQKQSNGLRTDHNRRHWLVTCGILLLCLYVIGMVINMVTGAITWYEYALLFSGIVGLLLIHVGMIWYRPAELHVPQN